MISSLSDVAKMSCDAAAAVANKNYKRQSSERSVTQGRIQKLSAKG